MIVLIPAYEPDARLVDLVDAVHAAGYPVLVVNDGSSAAFDAVFDAATRAGATVIAHHPNRGKGYALRTGFAHIARQFPDDDVVCADCDGQHRVDDIVRVARAVADHPDTVVLGARRFTGDVPMRSRFGNAVTRVVFTRLTGRPLADTQTGLRGYSASLVPWLMSVDGDRFEYELNVLLQALRRGIHILEVPIATVYLDGNASSHFRPLIDSARVWAPLVKFSLSSLGAFAVDFVMLLATYAVTGRLLVSVLAARAVSSVCNFSVNRWLVFRAQRGTSLTQAAAKYFSLVVAIVAVNAPLMFTLHEVLGLAIGWAKVVTEVTVFFVSYHLQRRVVFRRTAPDLAGARRPVAS